MEHSFDVKIAEEYGIAVALLLKHINFWCEKNKENDKHLREGRYWTYHSISSLQELFPYLTIYQIRQALKDMVKEDLIIVGKFPNRTNRSKWYALTEKGKSICRNQQMDLSKSNNPFNEIDKCIVRNRQMDLLKSTNAYTDINTYIYNTDNNTTDIDTEGGGEKRHPRTPKKPKPVKHRYGEYNNVLLTDDELAKLRDICDADEMIERLSGYIASTGKKYKSHYATIRNWIRREEKQQQYVKVNNPFLQMLLDGEYDDDDSGGDDND